MAGFLTRSGTLKKADTDDFNIEPSAARWINLRVPYLRKNDVQGRAETRRTRITRVLDGTDGALYGRRGAISSEIEDEIGSVCVRHVRHSHCTRTDSELANKVS